MLKIGLLLAPTYRSRAIIQLFAHQNIDIQSAILLPDQEPIWNGEDIIPFDLYEIPEQFNFKPGKSVQDSLKELDIPFSVAPTNDVNTPKFIDFIQQEAPDTYIYSGVAGCILRSDLLRQSGKKFIHAHGGDAPRYSGSTAFYYSILEENTIGATAFWMEEGLDTGDVITKLITKPHPNIEIDRIQDPLIRAETFVMALKKITKNPNVAEQQDHSRRVTYHVIHPILKHLALKKITRE